MDEYFCPNCGAIGDNYCTADERTLLALYLEDTKAQTEENISDMQKELTSAEKELFLLAADVLEKLSSLTEEEFQKLDLFSDFPM